MYTNNGLMRNVSMGHNSPLHSAMGVPMSVQERLNGLQQQGGQQDELAQQEAALLASLRGYVAKGEYWVNGSDRL